MAVSRQFVETTIACLDQAAEANLRTPGRQGNLVVLTPNLADELMITGDLHGHQINFSRIKEIAALDEHPRRHLLLQEVCHGGPTYPEGGGCMSHILLEDVARLKVQYPERIHFILGNHELAEMTDYLIRKNRQLLNLQFRLGMLEMYGPATEEMQEAYCRFLRSCPLAVRLSSGVFISHSVPEGVDVRGFNREVFACDPATNDVSERNDLFQLVWGRDYRPENARAFADLIGVRVLINGHDPCYEGFAVPNDQQVILDCSSDNAAYLILPVGRELSHAEVVSRIQRLTTE